MPHYRLYFFNGVGHIDGLHEFEATDDRAAVAAAALRKGAGAMELWSGDRKLQRWEPAVAVWPDPVPEQLPLGTLCPRPAPR